MPRCFWTDIEGATQAPCQVGTFVPSDTPVPVTSTEQELFFTATSTGDFDVGMTVASGEFDLRLYSPTGVQLAALAAGDPPASVSMTAGQDYRITIAPDPSFTDGELTITAP